MMDLGFSTTLPYQVDALYAALAPVTPFKIYRMLRRGELLGGAPPTAKLQPSLTANAKTPSPARHMSLSRMERMSAMSAPATMTSLSTPPSSPPTTKRVRGASAAVEEPIASVELFRQQVLRTVAVDHLEKSVRQAMRTQSSVLTMMEKEGRQLMRGLRRLKLPERADRLPAGPSFRDQVQKTMVAVDETLATLLHDGTIRLLRCSWLLALHHSSSGGESPPCFQRMQDLPAEAFATPGEAEEALRRADRSVLVLSAAALMQATAEMLPDALGVAASGASEVDDLAAAIMEEAEESNDKELTTLGATLEQTPDLTSAQAQAAFANVIAHLQREKKKQSLSELLLFVGVSCVPQLPRTEEEEATFQRALSGSCALFASLSTAVLQDPGISRRSSVHEASGRQSPGSPGQRARLAASPEVLPPLGWCAAHEVWATLLSGFVRTYWPDQADKKNETKDEAKKKPEAILVAQRFREKLVRITSGQEEGQSVKLPLAVDVIVKRMEAAGFDDLHEEMLMARLTREFDRGFLTSLRRAFWVS